MPVPISIEERRLFDAVCRMARYRGLTVDHDRSVVTCVPSRRKFRVYASNASVRFVALFADFNAIELQRPNAARQPAAVRPSDRAVDAAISAAHTETEHLQTYKIITTTHKRRLDLVLIHCEQRAKTATVGIDARFYIDHFRLNRERAQVINCDLWHLDELFIDVLAHKDVPVHRLATEKERTRFNVNKLPFLLMDDPARRWHGFLIDDIIAVDIDDADTGRETRLLHVVERSGPAVDQTKN